MCQLCLFRFLVSLSWWFYVHKFIVNAYMSTNEVVSAICQWYEGRCVCQSLLLQPNSNPAFVDVSQSVSLLLMSATSFFKPLMSSCSLKNRNVFLILYNFGFHLTKVNKFRANTWVFSPSFSTMGHLRLPVFIETPPYFESRLRHRS